MCVEETGCEANKIILDRFGSSNKLNCVDSVHCVSLAEIRSSIYFLTFQKWKIISCNAGTISRVQIREEKALV